MYFVKASTRFLTLIFQFTICIYMDLIVSHQIAEVEVILTKPGTIYNRAKNYRDVQFNLF